MTRASKVRTAKAARNGGQGKKQAASADQLQRPASATHGAVATVGLIAFLLALVILRTLQPFADNVVRSALFIITVTAGSIFAVDLLWQKVHRRASTGVDFAYDDPSWQRSLTKLTGLIGSFGFVALMYWLFPEYHGAFYERYYAMLLDVVPLWLLLAVPYFYLIDRHMPSPCDGYWQLGRLLTLQQGELDRRMLGQHLLGWIIKGFFLPLMFTYMCNDLGRFLAFDLTRLANPQFWFDFFYDLFYFIDVSLVAMGYLMSLRLTDTHLRSAEPTMLGWAAALVCYEPFWSLIGRQYLAYETSFNWSLWLADSPLICALWGTAILALTAVYAWSTVVFGARFSNLTHRGIITNGPYRWTRHPAYVAKNLSWWMLFMPFLAQGAPADKLRYCLLLLGLNAIYLLRAKTEEWHLSNDPDYVNYARWIDANGIFRWIQHVPLFRHLFRNTRLNENTP